MKKERHHQTPSQPVQPQTPERKPFEEPKLTYVPPKLETHGKVEDVTLQGFFGTFSP